MIVLIAAVSMLVAYFVASSLFGSISGESAKVKTIDPINATIVEPSTDIFNKNAINPAVQVEIKSTQSGTQ